VSDVYLFLADGGVLLRQAHKPSRLATPNEIDDWRADQIMCWGCPASP
jgi:hypothetical protein